MSRTLPNSYRVSRAEARDEMVRQMADYTRAGGWNRETPAIGKLKSSERQMAMLKRETIACNCIGGISMHDRDLQKLIRSGLMRFTRVRYAGGWGGKYDLRRTYAVLTEKGRNLILLDKTK